MRVRVIAPSRSLPEDAATLVQRLADKFAGLTLEIDPQCFASAGHFAGSDETRAAAFLNAANDPDVDAIWFARGGYGACRLLDKVIDGLTPLAAHKIYLGYSDGGYLLGALDAKGVGKVVHGPMVADGLREGGKAALERVLTFLMGDEAGVEPVANTTPSCAFNLTVLSSLVAGPHCPDFSGRLVMIEEVDEHLYAIDRMLFTLFTSGRLHTAKGLALGRLSGVPDNDIPFGEDGETMVKRWCAAYGVHHAGTANIGHDADNGIVPFG